MNSRMSLASFDRCGVAPVERPTPLLSTRITSRWAAMPSISAGSQLSRLPRKCCRKTTGVEFGVAKPTVCVFGPIRGFDGEVGCGVLGHDCRFSIFLLECYRQMPFESPSHQKKTVAPVGIPSRCPGIRLRAQCNAEQVHTLQSRLHPATRSPRARIHPHRRARRTVLRQEAAKSRSRRIS